MAAKWKVKIGSASEVSTKLAKIDRRTAQQIVLEVKGLAQQVQAIVEWFAAGSQPKLASLSLLDAGFRDTVPDPSPLKLPPTLLARWGKATPRLKELGIRGHLFLDQLAHPTVEDLTLEGEVWSGLFEAKGGSFPTVTTLTLRLDTDEHGIARGWRAAASILDGKALPKLRHLDLSRARFDADDELCAEELGGTKQLSKLQQLELTCRDEPEQLDAFVKHAAKLGKLGKLVLHDVVADPRLQAALGKRVVFTKKVTAASTGKLLAQLERKLPAKGKPFGEFLQQLAAAIGKKPAEMFEVKGALHALFEAGRVDDALNSYRVLLRSGTPKEHARFTQYASGRLAAKGHAQAAFDLLQASAAVPADYENCLNQAATAGQLEQGMIFLRRLGPRLGKVDCAHFLEALTTHGDPAVALEATDAYVAANPRSSTAWRARGLALLSAARVDEAGDAFVKQEELDGDEDQRAYARYNRAYALMRAGRFQEALAIVEQEPERLGVTYLLDLVRSQAMAALGDQAEALRSLQQFVERGGDYARERLEAGKLPPLGRLLEDYPRAFVESKAFVAARKRLIAAARDG